MSASKTQFNIAPSKGKLAVLTPGMGAVPLPHFLPELRQLNAV